MKRGFTLIELMVVVLIVAVLAAILIPMLTARLEAARWAEGKAGCGTLATAIRATYAELGEESWGTMADPTDVTNYLNTEDLRGKYFSANDYTIAVSLNPAGSTYPLDYTISVGQPSAPTVDVTWTKLGYQLDETGTWTELSVAP